MKHLIPILALALAGCTTANYKHTTETGPDGTRKTERSASYASVKGDASSAFDGVASFVSDNSALITGIAGTTGVGGVAVAGLVGWLGKRASASRERVRQDYEAYIAGRDAARSANGGAA